MGLDPFARTKLPKTDDAPDGMPPDASPEDAAAAPVPVKKPVPSLPVRFFRYIRKHWFIYLLVLPGLIAMIVFNYGPMYGLQIAFKKLSVTKGVWGSPWVGLDNFTHMFVDKYFWVAFKNTVIINLLNLAFGFTFNIFLALMLNEIRFRRLKSVIQTSVYLPYFLSWVIFAGLVMTFLSRSDDGGFVNAVISAFGGQEIDFLKKPELFRAILTVSAIVKTAGYSTIIYLAAIAGVSPDHYESAMIDGANRYHLIRYITLPRIYPAVAVMLILQVSGLFSSNFDQVYNLYSPFVYSTGDVLSTYIYRMSIGGGGEYEVATATNLLFNAMGMVVVLGANRFIKKLDVMGIF